MSTYRRRYLRKGISHAMLRLNLSACGLRNDSSEWMGNAWDTLKSRTINSANRQCEACVRQVGKDW